MSDALRNTYREEARELLANLEDSLLELESNPGNEELVGRVFRCLHTVKGSGAMFGFDRIAAFTHEVETVFDRVRSGSLVVTHELISLTLQARDHIRGLLEAEFGGSPPDPAREAALRAQYQAFSAAPATEAVPEAPEQHPRQAQETPRTYRIGFRPAPGIFLNGTRPELLLNELREMGTCGVVADTSGLPLLEDLDPESCYLAWTVTLESDRGADAIRDVFLFVEDACDLTIEAVDAVAVARESGPAAGGEVQGETPEAVQEVRARPEASASIRVGAAKLDSLLNGVGELVTAQARLSRIASVSGDPELEFVAEEMERLIDRLRADAMGLRMLPIGSTFTRFRRLVRDLARELGKEVELTTDGEDTELDKNVIEQLSDPLVHIIRNSVDHGIERPDVRTAQGKPSRGQVRLSAMHAGAHVLIRISDDGAGLDRDAILRKAMERHLVEPGTEMAEGDIFKLIFKPGFSTAAKVTEVSGRGVGLDVVERSTTALRGSVEVRSRKGEGTVFTLKLPLTLAIIDGLLVCVGREFFVIPVADVLECVELTRADERAMHGRNAVVVRGEMVPYVPLRRHFAIPGEPPAISQVILAETDRGKFGFLVDRVIGDHQTVIKSLGPVYRGVESVSGATILGDGSVALILDPGKLVQEALLCA